MHNNRSTMSPGESTQAYTYKQNQAYTLTHTIILSYPVGTNAHHHHVPFHFSHDSKVLKILRGFKLLEHSDRYHEPWCCLCNRPMLSAVWRFSMLYCYRVSVYSPWIWKRHQEIIHTLWAWSVGPYYINRDGLCGLWRPLLALN